jgi:hypothetical protein
VTAAPVAGLRGEPRLFPLTPFGPSSCKASPRLLALVPTSLLLWFHGPRPGPCLICVSRSFSRIPDLTQDHIRSHTHTIIAPTTETNAGVCREAGPSAETCFRAHPDDNHLMNETLAPRKNRRNMTRDRLRRRIQRVSACQGMSGTPWRKSTPLSFRGQTV